MKGWQSLPDGELGNPFDCHSRKGGNDNTMTAEKRALPENSKIQTKNLTSRIKCAQIAIFNNSTEEKTNELTKKALVQVLRSPFSVLQLVRALFIG